MMLELQSKAAFDCNETLLYCFSNFGDVISFKMWPRRWIAMPVSPKVGS